MAKPKGVHTKRRYVYAGADALVESLKGRGCKVQSKTISIPTNALGIYLLGAVDYLVAEHGYSVVRLAPQETAYTIAVRTLRQTELRRKASLVRKPAYA